MFDLKNLFFRFKAGNRFIFYPDISIALTYRCNLDCDYCYVKGLEKLMPDEISIKNLNMILDWLDSQNKKNILLYGGEPTIHSKFTEIMKILKSRGFQVGLYTNNVFDKSKLKYIDNSFVRLFQVNSNNPAFYTKEQLDTYNHNLHIINKKGIKIIFRYVLTQDSDLSRVLRHAKKYDSDIMFGISFKGWNNNASFLGYKDRKLAKEKILSFIMETRKNKILSYLSHPIPLCLFDKNEWSILKKYALACSTCNSCEYGKFSSGSRIINPDLSVFACFFIFQKANNILDFDNLEELSDYFMKSIDRLKWKTPLFPECLECEYFRKRICQGSCLGAKNK